MILSRRAALAGIAALTLATPAFAHHGWSWTEFGLLPDRGDRHRLLLRQPPSHARHRRRRHDLADRARAAAASSAAGLSESTIVVGDEITAIGNRSQDESEMRMKAVRVIVKGQTYDVYPDRAKDI